MKKLHAASIALISVILQTPMAFADCSATVSRKWNISKKTNFLVEASSLGPDCKRAVVVIVVRDGEGEAKYSLSMAAKDNAVFSNLADTRVTGINDMRTSLATWLDAGLSSNKNRLSKFLEWKAGTDGPAETPPAEFPFTVSSEISRATYEAWRKQNVPVYCFVQGMESMRCVVLTKEGTINEVGIQSFPG
jgi:hypothetical protein